MNTFRVIVREIGVQIVREEKYLGTRLEAEKYCASLWNRFYCLSTRYRLYLYCDDDKKAVMTIG